MLANRVYDICLQRIRQLHPQERITRLRNFAWIVAGIRSSRSVHLSHIAEKIPGDAKSVSKTQRVRRFLKNSAIRVRAWYEPIARALLQQVVAHGLEVRLLTDGTKVGFGHQLLMVALAGCTGMDVVSILKKMRQDLERFEVRTRGVLADEHPKKYTSIEVIYDLSGPDLCRDKVVKAVTLSEDRYCGIVATLRPAVDITRRIILNGEEVS